MGFIFKLDFLGREILGSQGGICKDTALLDVTPYIEPLKRTTRCHIPKTPVLWMQNHVSV